MAARGILSKLLSCSQLGLTQPCSAAWPGGLQQMREIHGTGRKKRPGGGGYDICRSFTLHYALGIDCYPWPAVNELHFSWRNQHSEHWRSAQCASFPAKRGAFEWLGCL